MEQPKQLPSGLEIYDNQLWMHRCPKCHRENYIFNVSSGICTWCGYNANKDYPVNSTDNGDCK